MPIGLFVLALAAFAVGTGEFIVSGLLPNLAADLGVGIPTVGLLVTVYAGSVALGGPGLALLTAGLPRKPLIVVLMVIFCLAQAFCALAPSYAWLMTGRVLAACSHGLFFGAGSVAAIELVPAGKRGRAMALFLGGITVANVLGIPAGAAIGNAFGWRWSFWAVGACGLVATYLVARFLPRHDAPREQSYSIAAEFRALAHHHAYLSYLTITLALSGLLAFVTYQVPAMILVAGIARDWTPLYLVITGVGAIVGMYAGGRAADWRLMPSMMTILLSQAAMAALLIFAMPSSLAFGPALFAYSVASWALNAPVQSRILTATRAAPHLASTLISTAYNIGIALGAWIGALWIDAGLGYQSLPVAGVIGSLMALGVAGLSWALDRRETRAPRSF